MDFTGPPYGKWNEQLGANATNQTDQKAKILVDSMLNGKSGILLTESILKLKEN
ncbi:Lipoprotein [Caenorhabditis elegans]|uniref:Lipoprotein n=1 Tax=Caenorhabditis elegans TaxID=6239 RepID=D3KFW2_CAEEL|nr:Lipoprotein [Caenorhabditis elegans]CBJ25090.1 Lipoprotein [Caenorhabditis elegans]|eukprot:NP_001254243.1 Uncharacterized protein CELE_M02G9.4 [Caenorhabditis elegans]